MDEKNIRLYIALVAGKLANHGDTPSYTWLSKHSRVNISEIRDRLYELEDEQLLVIDSPKGEPLRVCLEGEKYTFEMPETAYRHLYPHGYEEPIPFRVDRIKGWEADAVFIDESQNR